MGNLVVVITDLHAVVDDPITAARRAAVVEAGICLQLVAIVAGFALLDDAIAAASDHAILRAAVAIVVVAVVAFFTTYPDLTVAAACNLAGGQADIGLV